jgi:hypothetical protein
MFRPSMHWVVVSALATSAASAHAQQQGPAQVNNSDSLRAGSADAVGSDDSVKKAADEHPAGTYAGVLPGGAQAPSVPVAAGQKPASITWPGFQMRPDGTSRVFFQSTVPVPVETSVAPGKFILKLPNTQIAGDNNRLPLETRFFNTPVTRVTLTHARDGVTITLELRAPVAPKVSAERGASGYSFTYVDLPAGDFLSEADKQAAAVPTRQVGGAPQAAAKAPVPGDMPTFLDDTTTGSASGSASGQASVKGSASAHVDTSMDHELPPGMKPTGKAQSKAQANTKAKTKAKTEAKTEAVIKLSDH